MRHGSFNSTSVAVALWGALLGCCVWGLNATQAAAGVSVSNTKEFIGAEDSREALRLQENARTFATLGYLSEILLNQTEPLRHYQYHYAQAVFASDQELSQPAFVSSGWGETPAALVPFTSVRNRWSYGFH